MVLLMPLPDHVKDEDEALLRVDSVPRLMPHHPRRLQEPIVPDLTHVDYGRVS